jgi:hypothetical protein
MSMLKSTKIGWLGIANLLTNHGNAIEWSNPDATSSTEAVENV